MKKNKWLLFVAFCISVLLSGCSSGGGGGGSSDTTTTTISSTTTTSLDTLLTSDSDNDGLGYDLTTVQVQLDAFSVAVDSTTSLATTGEQLTASVRTTGGSSSGSLSYLWDLPTGGALAQGTAISDSSISFSFSSAGEYLVSVTVTDTVGNHSSSGAVYYITDPATLYTIGDLSADSLLDSDDVALLSGHLDGTTKLDASQLKKADITLDGRIVDNDLALLQAAVAAGDAAPTYLSTSQGRAGSTAFIIHPALLDPAAMATVKITAVTAGTYDDTCLTEMNGKPHWDEVTFNRSEPGYLAFRVPVKYSCLSSTETAKVSLEVSDGASTQSFTLSENFSITALPAASATPGAMVLEVMAQLRMAIKALPTGIEAYADAVGADPGEKAFLVGSLTAAADLFDEQYGQFYVAFNALDDPTKQAWEQMAMAGGLEELLSQLTTQSGRFRMSTRALQAGNSSRALSTGVGQALVDMICSFNQILDISSSIADINESVAGVLEYLDWWPLNTAPVIGPVIQVLSRISNIISMVTDLISSIGQYVPELGDEINVETTKSALDLGEITGISASIDVMIVSGLCDRAGDAAGDLIDDLKDRILSRIASKIPGIGSSFHNASISRDDLGTVAGYVYDAISAVAGSIIDASGIKDYMSSLISRVCDFFGDPKLPLATDFLGASCGTIVNSAWTCTESCADYPVAATVSFSGDKPICGRPTPGEASVTCQDDPPQEILTATVGNSSMDIGDTTSATATYTVDGQSSVVQAQWVSGSPAVASIGNGVVSALSVGGSVLTATYTSPLTGATLTGNTLVQVFDPNNEVLTVSVYESTIFVGDATSVSATYTKGRITENVTSSANWTSSAPGVATVSANGGVTGISEGTATFTAGYTAPITGTVFNESTGALLVKKAETFSVLLYQSSIEVGQTTSIAGHYSYRTNVYTDVTASTAWSSSNSAIATVSNTGGVTGVDVGTATITGVYTSPNTGVVWSEGDGITVTAPTPSCCYCGDPGVTLTASGCTGWPDATQCSGWHSVGGSTGCENDGQSYTGYGCTITIHCP
ncbi:MAG: Ig-like domain-containing protein [Proteobacteria bacterium]|nr:Ig-like domain-containing protein [Pseudomonadota bacterium]MBU1688441.1 Ig-like domain-containing protein [Pseudomonadota bacterium]